MNRPLLRTLFAALTFGLGACGSEEPVALVRDGGNNNTPDSGETPDSGAEALRITTSSLPDTAIGRNYDARVEAAGGAPPYSFALTRGALPSSLTFSSDGVIGGLPALAGTSRFTVQVTDSGGATASAQLVIKVVPGVGEILEITTLSLPDGAVGVSYDATLQATGGSTPYVWSIASGALPPGISLGTDGVLSGSPSSVGSATVIVQVTDSGALQQQATASFTVVIAPQNGDALEIVEAALPSGAVGQAYNAALQATGGNPTYSWSVTAGTSLPSGLVLASDGTISGTPLQSGATTFSVQVLDSSNPQQIAVAQRTITVDPAMGAALEIVTAALPDGAMSVAYAATVTATGGAEPYDFVVIGALPAGLALAPDGVLSGVPAEAGTFNFTVQVSDASSPVQVASRSYTITIVNIIGMLPLAVATVALPDGQVDQAYAALLQASGGITPYQWALDPNSSLPPGLALSSDGQIGGTPTASGRFTFSVVVADASIPQQTASAGLTITILPQPGATLMIVTASLPSATAGLAYSATLQAGGGTAPYDWLLVAGSLPRGITLAAGGTLSGTSTITGNFSFTVEVTDASSPLQTTQATLSLSVLPAPGQLAIITGTLPRAVVNQPYRAQLQASGGAPPYQWSLAFGELPPGLTITSTGAIVGTTTIAGTFSFTPRVNDASLPQQTAERALAITSFAPPGASGLSILNQTLPAPRIGSPYNAQIAVAGGTRPYALSVSAGALPPGITLDPASSRLSGVPTSTGTFTFTLRASDASTPQLNTERRYSLTVRAGNRPLRITTRMLPQAMVGVAYSARFAAIGGQPPYQWSLSAGVLPAGLMLDATGNLTGTSSVAGTSMFTVQVRDGANATASRGFNLVIR